MVDGQGKVQAAAEQRTGGTGRGEDVDMRDILDRERTVSDRAGEEGTV